MVVEGSAFGLYLLFFVLFAFSAFMSLRKGVGKRTNWENRDTHIHTCKCNIHPFGAGIVMQGSQKWQETKRHAHYYDLKLKKFSMVAS